jgi:hypothetical protein
MSSFDDHNIDNVSHESDIPDIPKTGISIVGDPDNMGISDTHGWQNDDKLSYRIPDLNDNTNDLATELWGGIEYSHIDPYEALARTFEIEIHGTPLDDMSIWDPQDDMYSCAVATTNMLFRSLGLDVGESLIAGVFGEMGIYDPAFGTDPYLIDDTLNFILENSSLDIRATETSGFNVNELSKLLDNNIRPLICVDSYELYGNSELTLNELSLIPDAGHAVQLTGIIHTSDHSYAIINDPGIPEGAGQKIDLSKFMDAAADYGYKAIYLA